MKIISLASTTFLFLCFFTTIGFGQEIGDRYWLKEVPSLDDVNSSWRRSDGNKFPRQVGLSKFDDVKVISTTDPKQIAIKFTSIKKVNFKAEWIKIDTNFKISMPFEDFNKYFMEDDGEKWKVKVNEEILKMCQESRIIRNKDLISLLRKETAFTLSGEDDASVLAPFASLTTIDNTLSFGFPVEFASRTFIVPKASVKLSKESEDINLTNDNIGKDINIGFRFNHFKKGVLTNGDDKTKSAEMCSTRESRLTNQENKFDAEYQDIHNIYDNFSAKITKDSINTLSDAQENTFWAEDLKYYLKNSPNRKLTAGYFFLDFESSLGDKKIPFRDSLSAKSIDKGFLAFSGELGYGQIVRGGKYRTNWTLSAGFQNISNATSGLLDPTTISTVKNEVDSIIQLKETTEYIGTFKQQTELFFRGSYLYYFANSKFENKGNIEIGAKASVQRILTDIDGFRKKNGEWSLQVGPIFSLRDKDSKPSVVLFPYIDLRDNHWSFRLSAGVPF